MRKTLCLVLGALLVVGLAGCQKGKDEKPLVGYVCNNFNDTFQGYIMDEFKKFFTDKTEFTLDFQDAQEDVIKQQDQANNLISKGAKALVVVPVNTSAMEPITRAAREAKIPLVFVNRNPFADGKMPENVFYVGSQEIIAGQLQMEAMGKALNGVGGVAILMGKLDNEGAVLRTQGNENTAKEKFPNISVLAKETGNWQRDQAMSLTENWITTYGAKLKGILGNNDEMALGAIEALKAAGRGDVVVMGVDRIPDAITAVKNGSMAATVLQDAAGQGRGAAEAAYKGIRGESQAQINWVPFVLIDKSNIAQYSN
jgi:inositol transport system substrate-binding protein